MPVFRCALRRAFALGLALAATAIHAADGDLDPAFGVGGVARTGSTNTALNAMALRPDGRIVVCGSYADPTSLTEEFFVAQYRPDGSLDPAFGSGGVAHVDFSAYDDICTSLAIQDDGRIVVAGYTATPQSSAGDYYHPVLARLESNGAPDPGFGDGGFVTYAQGGDAAGVALQADGKIVLVGFAYEDDGIATDYGIVRFLPDGSPDPDFGINGRITINFAGTHTYDAATAVSLDRQQRIVIGGTADRYFIASAAVVRLLQDGSFDATFGNGGVAIASDDAGLLDVNALKLERDGNIVVAGNRSVNQYTDMMIARFLDDGSLDTAFGTQGIATAAFAPEGVAWRSNAFGVDEQSDGKYVLAGWAIDPDNDTSLVAARVDSDGSVDATFGSTGFSTFASGTPSSAYRDLNAIALSGGRILAAGTAYDDADNPGDLLIRLQNDLIFTDSF